MGDLNFRFPNLIEPWTPHLYGRLRDDSVIVKKTTLNVLSHLILNDMIKVKSQISDIALCIIDTDTRISDVGPASLEPDHFVPVVSFRVEQHDGFLRLRRAGQVERHLLRQFVVTRPLEGRQQTESLPLVVIDGHEDSGAPGPDARRVLEGSEQWFLK